MFGFLENTGRKKIQTKRIIKIIKEYKKENELLNIEKISFNNSRQNYNNTNWKKMQDIFYKRTLLYSMNIV